MRAPPRSLCYSRAMDQKEWPEFMTVADVAGIMKVSKMTVYRLVSSGVLAGQRVGPRTIRVSADTLRAYLEPRP